MINRETEEVVLAKSTSRTPTHWPSLEEQLYAQKVKRGSALEKLITDNQDFSILSPSELHDGLPFPPWLRVWWRKKHPEFDFTGGKVGYPLILKEILSWMLRHQDLPPGAGDQPTEQH